MPRHPLLALALSLLAAAPAAPAQGPLPPGEPVRGWTILSDSEPDDSAVIEAARGYDINHLQLSHDVVMDLRELRDPEKRARVQRLTDAAHRAGIREVVLWDHSLYDLKYYPERFRTGPGGTLDLDDPAFWEWFKQDYREMLDLAPHADGLVLTFVETGARAERQFSRRLATPQEKVAAVVNAVADVVIGERHLALYTRTFAYTHEEYRNLVGAIAHFRRPEIRLMMKETPHDFFLTHPNDFFAGTLARPTIIEFDAAGEFNGQGLIASSWPEYMLRRASDLLRRPHVIGYVARTDRYGRTRIVGRPSEINLYALRRYAQDASVTPERVYDEFIAARYGKAALPQVKAAFRNAFDIVTSTLYTLGTNTANHSALDYDPYLSSYSRHVSGKWFDPPVARVAHGVDRDFHYWKEVVDHLAPPKAKVDDPSSLLRREAPWVLDSAWVRPGERMDEEYLRYVLAEKAHGVRLAEESLAEIERARPSLREADYRELRRYFERTLLTARLHRGAAASYWGARVFARGPAFRTPTLLAALREGVRETGEVAGAIRAYPAKPPVGQWKWEGDAEKALGYREQALRACGAACAEPAASGGR